MGIQSVPKAPASIIRWRRRGRPLEGAQEERAHRLLKPLSISAMMKIPMRKKIAERRRRRPRQASSRR